MKGVISTYSDTNLSLLAGDLQSALTIETKWRLVTGYANMIKGLRANNNTRVNGNDSTKATLSAQTYIT